MQNALKGINSDSFLDNIKPVLPDYEPIKYELPTLRPSWHQLVVIGNGFDLECGLASDFSNFVKARTVDFEKADHGQIAEDMLFTKTIWDVILSSMGDANWCDIEGSIAFAAYVFGLCSVKITAAFVVSIKPSGGIREMTQVELRHPVLLSRHLSRLLRHPKPSPPRIGTLYARCNGSRFRGPAPRSASWRSRF